MTLEEFVAYKTAELSEFAAWWVLKNKDKPVLFPMDLVSEEEWEGMMTFKIEGY